jgi:mannose-6-phosphate isomerase-like protein (cupin superfamily)
MSTARKVSKENPMRHYIWGNQCEGWDLADWDSLSVKYERMPPGTDEQEHFHQQAGQFFYILKGEAVFEIEGERIHVNCHAGIQIEPGQKHRILNEGPGDLEFVLSSRPSTKWDRINIDR